LPLDGPHAIDQLAALEAAASATRGGKANAVRGEQPRAPSSRAERAPEAHTGAVAAARSCGQTRGAGRQRRSSTRLRVEPELRQLSLCRR
jgi:hypothetical protein